MYSGLSAEGSTVGRLYPERQEPKLGMLDRTAKEIGGLLARRFHPSQVRFQWIVEAVSRHGSSLAGLSDAEILQESRSIRLKLRREGCTQELTAKAFAMVREVSRRTLHMSHLDVQLIGGLVLLNRMVAEMETGEGKTLTATLPACTLALAGVPVHIVTVNDYLAGRDAEWMGPIYRGLGLTVGTAVHGMQPDAKRQAYRSDVTYCTNKELTFDYLRDRIVLWDRPGPLRLQVERLYGEESRIPKLLLRGLHFALVDEADSVLIDEARTPLIISSEGSELYHAGVYQKAIGFAQGLAVGDDYAVSENDRTVEISQKCRGRIWKEPWLDVGVSINEEQREELIRQALVALHLFDRDKHYLIKDGKIQIIDEYTGRLMEDRSWERGLHQLIELKEGCKPTVRKETRARISYQRFFRRYLGLAGMTGTAREVSGELWSIYGLKVVTIPTHRPMKRTYLPDRVYSDAERKWKAVVKKVAEVHGEGRPVLVGTRSVEASEKLSAMLEESDLSHRVLNARQDKEEAEIIAQAGQLGQITVATNMAGRGTDIKLGDGIREIGGLYVIATERHESRRIDRQLFGRSGRQGDPGTSEAFVSLEDDLIKTYVGKALLWLGARAVGRGRGAVTRGVGKWLCWKCQGSAERLNARMRRDLLRMDEQLSESLAFTGRTE
jgi:preprotein translocase subunit SecA